MDKNARSLCLAVLALALMCASVSKLHAQDQSASSTTPSSNSSEQIDKLQKEINELQSEINELQSEINKLKSQPAAQQPTSTPAAATSTVAATPAAPAASAAPAKNIWDSTSVFGYVDGYYGYDFNEPAGRIAGLRVFDNYQNQFSLNLAELGFSRTPSTTNRLGYNAIFGYGNAINVVNSSENATPLGASFDRNVVQAYISYLVPVGKGLQVDFGKFVTPAGAEVIENYGNWNYSRGILFGYAIPFYHFGLRAAYTFNPKVTLTGYLVNSWNGVVAPNTGKTYGFSLALTPAKKFTLTENYLGGPQTLNYNQHWRYLTDTVAAYNVTSKLSLLGNFDWGGGDLLLPVAQEPPGPLNPTVYWTGFAGYTRYAFTGADAFTVRYEYYNDHYGFTTGVPQHINEYTATLEHVFDKGLTARLEFRRDMSNQPFFPLGTNDISKNQNTLELGMFYKFDIHTAQ